MRTRTIIGLTGLIATTAVLGMARAPQADAQSAPKTTTAKAQQPLDRSTMHVQVILDKLAFGPGVIDGRGGESLKAALRGFQENRGLTVTGKPDAETMRALYQYRQWRPTKTITLTPAMLAGPYLNPIPKDYEEQAKLPALAYRSPLEKLAEMFHTTPETLVDLNSRETMLRAGTQIVVPNALPTSRSYDIKDATWRGTVDMLNVDATQPAADHIVVDKSEGVLKVYDAQNTLVAQFSATMGSAKFPLPLGTWTIKGAAYNPDWNFNPDLIANTKPGAKEAVLPPGPNNPVGVVWLDLSKPHYGIHGTAEPQNIGRSESNGCIRLTNWDVARLALMVKPGTKAVFKA